MTCFCLSAQAYHDHDTGKKQLNQLMTFLDTKGGSLKDGVGSGKGDTAFKAVRAKREADEAGKYLVSKYGRNAHITFIDKEYRKGVHYFETLRLRRYKILESAFKARVEIWLRDEQKYG